MPPSSNIQHMSPRTRRHFIIRLGFYNSNSNGQFHHPLYCITEVYSTIEPRLMLWCSLLKSNPNPCLVGGFSPTHLKKYAPSNWIISPDRDENRKYLKPPPYPSAGLFFIKGWPPDCTAFQKTEAGSAPPNRNPTFTVYLRTRKPTGGITS